MNMKMKRKNIDLQFKIDLIDYRNEDEIISTIRNILKLYKDEEFRENVEWEKDKMISVKVSPKLSFIISGCDC
jgi:hypothetical protein